LDGFPKDRGTAFFRAMLSSNRFVVGGLKKDMRGRDIPPNVPKICKYQF